MQEDVKITNKPYTQVNFLVARTKSKRDRLWELKKTDIVMEAAPNGQQIAKREITWTGSFYPSFHKNNVNYIIIPNTLETKKDDERKFFLWIFSSEPLDLVELPKTTEQSFPGKWTKETCGGKWVND